MASNTCTWERQEKEMDAQVERKWMKDTRKGSWEGCGVVRIVRVARDGMEDGMGVDLDLDRSPCNKTNGRHSHWRCAC